MKRIGAFTGKFYPPHIGHLSVVDNLKDEFDELWIIISYNPIRNDSIARESGFEPLSPNLIKSWFEEHYKGINNVKVAIFDESGKKPYPDNAEGWAKEFKKEFPTINAKIADDSYREYNETYFPEYEFVSIDRDVVNIHSTMIRNDTAQFLDKIIPEAREYFRRELNEK